MCLSSGTGAIRFQNPVGTSADRIRVREVEKITALQFLPTSSIFSRVQCGPTLIEQRGLSRTGARDRGYKRELGQVLLYATLREWEKDARPLPNLSLIYLPDRRTPGDHMVALFFILSLRPFFPDY